MSEAPSEHDDRLSRLTAAIINWQRADLTIRSAEALMRDGLPADRIVLVDNCSGDDSPSRLRQALPNCVLLCLHENVAYSRAANAAVEALPGDYLLILNNDSFVHRQGSLMRMVDALDHGKVGIVVPRLLNADLTLQRSVRPFSTPAVSFVQATGLSRFVPNRWQPRWSTHWDHRYSRAIDVADGPALLIRGQTWQELGGYNESIRFGEESDLCWRARKLRWITWFCADASFVHLGSATLETKWSRPDRAESVGRSEGRIIREQLPRLRAALAIAFIGSGLAARYLLFKVIRRSQAAHALRAELHGYLTPERVP